MRRWLMYLLLVLVAASFAAVAVHLAQPKVRLLWNRSCPEMGELMLALDNDTLFVSDPNRNYVRAYRLDGQQLWEFKPPHPPGMVASLNVDEATCYVSTNSNWLYALDNQGKLLWERKLSAPPGRWGFKLRVANQQLVAQVDSGDFSIFDRAGTLIETGNKPVNTSQFSYQFNAQARRNIYFGPGAKSVIDTQGRLWMAQPGSSKLTFLQIDRLIARLMSRPRRNPGAAVLTVNDPSGNPITKTRLPFTFVSNAFSLPDGSVVFVGGLGRMACYSLDH